ncbi:hypothetical protein PVAP13_7KG209510, partial [Panicum virgatum]
GTGAPPSWSFTAHHPAPARPCSPRPPFGRARRGSPSSGTALGEEDGSISATQVRSNDRERPRGWTVFHLPSTRARGVVTRNTVHPLAPRAPSARRRPRRRAAPSGVLTSAGRSCCCGWATPELCTSPPREGAAPAGPSAALLPGMTMLAPRRLSSPSRLPTAAFSRTPVAPTQSRRLSSSRRRPKAVHGGPPSHKRVRVGCMVSALHTSPSKSA